MSLMERMEALQAKHAKLEQALAEENQRPLPDFESLTRIKREKLRIKDELERLDHTTHH